VTNRRTDTTGVTIARSYGRGPLKLLRADYMHHSALSLQSKSTIEVHLGFIMGHSTVLVTLKLAGSFNAAADGIYFLNCAVNVRLCIEEYM